MIFCLTIPSMALGAFVKCTGSLELLGKSQKLKPDTKSIIFSRNESSSLKVYDVKNNLLLTVFPWFGINIKRHAKTEFAQFSVHSDKYFEVSLAKEKKTLSCEIIYE